jgi:nucleoside-diphosphate-sugar epimerase
MRILITGNQGYIGRVMTRAARANGHEVAGLDSGLFRDCFFGVEEPPVPTLRKDLRDVEVSDLLGYDAVIHLAGICNDPLGDLNPELTMAVNYAGALRLALRAKQAGVRRFVNSSTCSVYGAGGDLVLDENAPLDPVTAYGESKRSFEQALSSLADDSFSPTHLRNATAYGVSPGLRLDLVVNDLVATAMSSGRILLKSDGTPWRPVVHVEDIAEAFLAVLNAPIEAVHDEIFNVGDEGENYQISELASIVAEIVPGCTVEYAAGAGPDKRCYRIKASKIREKLGFKTGWTVRRGACQLRGAFAKSGLSASDVASSRYKRLARVLELIHLGVLDSDLRYRQVRSAILV